MKTEELFENGVTPINGVNVGKRYRVLNIAPHEISVENWDDSTERFVIPHGDYKVWSHPKTVFEDRTKIVTLDSLYDAAHKANLPGSTRIYIREWDRFFGIGRSIGPANVSVATLNNDKIIIVE